MSIKAESPPQGDIFEREAARFRPLFKAQGTSPVEVARDAMRGPPGSVTFLTTGPTDADHPTAFLMRTTA